MYSTVTLEMDPGALNARGGKKLRKRERFLIRMTTVLVGNTSIRSEKYRTRDGIETVIKTKDVAQNPYRRDNDLRPKRHKRDLEEEV